MMCHALPMIAAANHYHWEILERLHKFAAKLSTNNFTSKLCTERQLTVYENGHLGIPRTIAKTCEIVRKSAKHGS